MSNDRGHIVYGLTLCWGLNLLEVFIGFFTLSMGFGGEGTGIVAVYGLVGGIGLFQLLYVLPIYFVLRKENRTDTIKGVIIAASITALLNATCWGMIWSH